MITLLAALLALIPAIFAIALGSGALLGLPALNEAAGFSRLMWSLGVLSLALSAAPRLIKAPWINAGASAGLAALALGLAQIGATLWIAEREFIWGPAPFGALYWALGLSLTAGAWVGLTGARLGSRWATVLGGVHLSGLMAWLGGLIWMWSLAAQLALSDLSTGLFTLLHR
ncbi:hypothetical protein KKF91_21295 [Myxococcota bacterium]|nr:hypothetical protein [Myxococcota bacterium]MBU1433081.1 hypothetical protein [Myxococcota bacterium]MBU1897083.1 hypothetical protein [Myxococcota bacterium]